MNEGTLLFLAPWKILPFSCLYIVSTFYLSSFNSPMQPCGAAPPASGGRQESLPPEDLHLPVPRNDSYQGSSTSSTISHSEMNDTATVDDGFTQVKKRRRSSRGSGASATTIITSSNPPNGLTVIVKPTDPNNKISKINAIKLTEILESFAPDGVIQIRPNHRLNVLAIDTRNLESTKALLKLTRIGSIQVLAYEPRPRDSAVGIIRDVDSDITDAELKDTLRATVPVTNARRLGRSLTVKLVFATPMTPEYVTIGYIRYKVHPYTEKPLQCSNCFGFGHVRYACTKPATCAQCGGQHDRGTCTAVQPRCSNCGKAHESTSRECAMYIKAKNISTYRSTHNVDYFTALNAVVSPRDDSLNVPPSTSRKNFPGLPATSVVPSPQPPLTAPTAAPTTRHSMQRTVTSRPPFPPHTPQPTVTSQPKPSTSSSAASAVPPLCPAISNPTVEQTPFGTTGIWHIVSLIIQVLKRLVSSSTSPIAQLVHQIIELIGPLVTP